MSNLDSMMRMILEQALSEKLSGQNQVREMTNEDFATQKRLLRGMYESFIMARDYEVGDIVVWKEGLKNRKSPLYGQPAIVMEMLDECEYAEREETGSIYFMEPLNVRLGFIDDDGDFVSYLFDARKFKKAKEQ